MFQLTVLFNQNRFRKKKKKEKRILIMLLREIKEEFYSLSVLVNVAQHSQHVQYFTVFEKGR